MKTFKTAVSLFLLSSFSAIAADLPSIKSAPAATPMPMWTGFYAGLNAGGTWSNGNPVNLSTSNVFQPASSADYVAAALLTSSRPSPSNGGFIGGGQIGYNRQTQFGSYNFVLGLEADMQGVAGSNSSNGIWTAAPNAGVSAGNTSSSVVPYSLLANSQSDGQLNWLGTVRGRLGYLLAPNLLVFGSGGLAYGAYNSNLQTTVLWQSTDNSGANFIQYGAGNYSKTLVGWTAGGGVEWLFQPNMSVKVEYLYYDLGTGNGSVINPVYGVGGSSGVNSIESVTSYSLRSTGNIVRAGLNYHFNFASAPVIAKF
jgi:outer membrane immunogenic protein